jgi:hypothetical protein
MAIFSKQISTLGGKDFIWILTNLRERHAQTLATIIFLALLKSEVNS